MESKFVAEIEGEYGPLTISERLVQKLWARGDFRRRELRTLEGKSLEILNLGEWNLLAGPDFKGVSINVDGHVLNGDAELHFFDSDWEAHGHNSDPAFAKVILHILVFPPKPGSQPAKCFVPHSLLFLDLLPQGLEAYAEEEALGALSSSIESNLEEEMLGMHFQARIKRLVDSSKKRWNGKVRYARKRIDTLGWQEACHQSALEILGYRYNRTSMLFLAGDYSLGALKSGAYTADHLYEAGLGRWRTSGTRPANHPKTRLVQYLEWVSKRPEWPELLLGMKAILKDVPDNAGAGLSRKELQLSTLKKKMSQAILADTVGGSRIETLICDGFLPLLTAQSQWDLFPLWYPWFPGDMPSVLKRLISRILQGSAKPAPISNGALQGILQLILEKSGPL